MPMDARSSTFQVLGLQDDATLIYLRSAEDETQGFMHAKCTLYQLAYIHNRTGFC